MISCKVMEKSKKTLLITLALVFFGILLLASVYATKEYTGNIYHANPQVVQTYKSYNSDEIVNIPVKTVQTKPIQTRPIQTYYLNKNENRICRSYGSHCYYNYYDYQDPEIDNSIHYTQHGTETTRKGFLGDYVKEYSAYVTNTGQTGRYFTVTFNLEDKRGQEFSQSVTQYLKTGERKKFVYRDIQYERNEIIDWNYDIIPEVY